MAGRRPADSVPSSSTPPPGFGVGPAVVIMVGVALVGGGVALNETGFDAGRVVLVAGFPIAFVGLFLAWRVGGSLSSARALHPGGGAGATPVAEIAAHMGLRPTEDGAGFRGTFRERTTEL
ncbi:MAG: hypothetical protein AAGN82_29450, partial [Myxococcota bacterium]